MVAALPTLHGRAAPLAALRAGLDAALDGRGRLAIVSGEAGIGKSALAAQIAAEAEARGAAVTWGRAWEFADAPPYFPVLPCLRELGLTVGADAFALWESFVSSLARASGQRPVVWVLEDLHAADLGSLDLLTFLAQPLRAMRALVVATVREGDPRLTDRMVQRIARMARDGIDVRLEPLTALDVAAVAEAAVGRALPAQELRRLVELTGGNPLFVVECARAVKSAGGVEGALAALPPTIRQVVLDRVTLLAQPTRDTLACGAVLGREFDAATVARMRASLPARVIDALLPAIRSGVITETRPGRFLFGHALVRDAIEDALDPDERSELHARAEEALAPQGDAADVLLERSRHAIAALRRGGEARARELAQRAVALLEGEGAFDRAYELLSRLDDARRSGFLAAATPEEDLELARAAREAGRSDVTRAVCERLVSGARGRGDAETLARAVLLHASDVRPGVVDRAQVLLLEEARAALGDGHPALRCRVIARYATALQPTPDQALPDRLIREALEIARPLGDEGALIDVLDQAPWALFSSPRAERIAVARELRERALAAGLLPKALMAQVSLAFYHLEGGEFGELGRVVGEALALAEAVGHPRYRWRPLLLASMTAVSEGRFADSDRYVTEVRELAALIDDRAFGLSMALHELQRARIRRADDEVRAVLPRLEEIMAEMEEGHVFAALMRCSSAARLGDVELARRSFPTMGGSTMGIFVDPASVGYLAEACAAGGSERERRAARDALAALSAHEAGVDVTSFVYEGPPLRLLGLVDAALGDLAAAERELREAHALSTARGHWPWVAQIASELAAVQRRRGDERGAAESVAESARIARQLGMPGLAGAPEIDDLPAEPALAVRVEKTAAGWVVGRGARAVTVKDSRGMQLLARLVARRGEEIHVLALASDEGASVPESNAGEHLDDRARAAYRQRLADIDGDLAEAERDADAGRIARLAAEREALLTELARAVGLGGRGRVGGSATERARINVQKRLKEAVARIGEQDEALGRWFDRGVRTGTFCCFRP